MFSILVFVVQSGDVYVPFLGYQQAYSIKQQCDYPWNGNTPFFENCVYYKVVVTGEVIKVSDFERKGLK